MQEGTWPDVRQRGSLLGMDELVEVVAGREPGEVRPGSDVAAVTSAARLLADERRLFYVAVTRARRELVVTAIGAEDSEERPSRFLAELAGDDIQIEHVAGTGRRWLSLPATDRGAAARRGQCEPAPARPGQPRRPSSPGSPLSASAGRAQGSGMR